MTPKIEGNYTSNNEFVYLNNINKVSYGCDLNLLKNSDITIQRNLVKLTFDRTFETHLGIICAVLAVLNIIYNTAFIYGLIAFNLMIGFNDGSITLNILLYWDNAQITNYKSHCL